ncbi:MAG: tripartite tricarboxylate transporter substrate binding protein [Alcaligenaceae bacterium]|nr:tripartite tricarboxylate transporter substrate binding protein [Alcaligenaceae bacterium]
MIRKLFLALLPLAFATPTATMAADAADAYPSSPINIIAPFPPGGGTDSMTRLVSTHLAQSTGWNVIAENRAGAGGTIGIASAARATPNGYQLVMGQVDNLAVAPWLYPNLSYDSVKDFAPIVNVAGTSVIIVTRADSPYKTLEDMIKAAKEKPGSIDYGSPGAGTITHLAAVLLQEQAGITLQHVPYKGSAPAMADLLSGQVPILFTSLPSAFGQLKAGSIRALAVTSSKRSAIAPDVPTVAERGYKDFDVTVWYGLLAPAGTPDAIVQKVNAEMNKILATDEMKKAMGAQGAEPLGGTSAEFAKTIERDRKKWGPIVEASGAKTK